MPEAVYQEANLSIPDKLTVPGPQGIAVRFTHPGRGLYSHAEIVRPGETPLPILFQTSPSSITLVSAFEAQANNAVIATKLQRSLPWSLSLWSLDGQYLVLTTFDVIDGKLDIRNSRSKSAYSTTTGLLVPFSNSEAGFLSVDSFAQWSPTKPESHYYAPEIEQ